MTSLNSLFAMSLGGLGLALGMGYLFNKSSSNRLKDLGVFKEALELMRQHRGVIHYLGTPISESNPTMNNKGMAIEGFSEIRTMVSGPKSNGVLFVKVYPNEENKPCLDSVQLQIGDDFSKRLVIKPSTRDVSEKLN